MKAMHEGPKPWAEGLRGGVLGDLEGFLQVLPVLPLLPARLCGKRCNCKHKLSRNRIWCILALKSGMVAPVLLIFLTDTDKCNPSSEAESLLSFPRPTEGQVDLVSFP